MTGSITASDESVEIDGEITPKGRLRWLLGTFYLVSAVFVLVAIASSLDRAGERVVPSVPAISVALIALTVALRATASGWSALVKGEASAPELRRCVYASQLGKYVPGGVVQAVGQVAIAGRIGIPLRTAFPAYIVYAGHVAFGALAVGAVLVSQSASVGVQWAVIGGLCVLAVVAASRPLLEVGVRIGQRFVPRLRRMGPLPDQGALLRCFALQMVFAVLQGLAFAVLVRSLDPDVPVLAAIGANAIAFGLGLLAVPVPSGLLVREGLLIAILHPVAGAATVVTAAIVQRLAAIAAEFVMLAASSVARRRATRVRQRLETRGTT